MFINMFINRKLRIIRQQYENEYNKHLKGCWWMSAEDAHKLRVCTEILYTTVLR